MAQFFRCIIFLSFLIPCNLVGVIVGSNTNVARQSLIVFSAADTDNKMLGFSRFNSGFTLADNTTSCTFDSLFPVSGDIQINQGILYLTKDLILNNGFKMYSFGKIWGNGYSLELSSTGSPLVLPSSGSVTTYSSINFLASALQDQQVWSVAWSYDNLYVAAATTTASGLELRVYSFNGMTLTLVASKQLGRNVYSIEWHPSTYKILVVATNVVGTSNSDVLVYNFDPGTSSVNFMTGIDIGSTSYCGSWSPNGNYVAALSKKNKVSVFSYNGTVLTLLYTLTTDLNLAQNAIAWSPDGVYIAGGVSQVLSGKKDVKIFKFNGSILTEVGGIETGLITGGLDWMQTDKGSFIAVGFYTGGSNLLRVYTFNSITEQITEQLSARDGESNTFYSVEWSPDKKYLLMGLANTAVKQIKIYKFDDQNISFSSATTFVSPYNVYSVRWSPNQLYFATGDSNSYLSVYGLTSITNNFFSSSPMLLNDTKVILTSQVIMRAGIECRNNCVISGRGNELILSPNAYIAVKPGASLILEDMILSGIKGSNLLCFGNDSTLTLRNCWLQFSQDFTFSTGSLMIEQDVYFSGTVACTYSSSSISKIRSQSMLHIENGMIFNYAPSIANKNLIIMEDNSASLFLNGSTLMCSSTGMKLSSGSLYFYNSVTFTNQANNLAEGFEFSSNLAINFLSKSFVNLYGFYRYV